GGRPALHERAPLRRNKNSSRAGGAYVVPLFMSGLHCGSLTREISDQWIDVVPLFMSGLHCGAPAPTTTPPWWPVVPLFMSGLHCGDFAGMERGTPQESSRSS